MNFLRQAALQVPAIRRLHQSCGALAGERDTLVGERDRLRGDVRTLTAERDAQAAEAEYLRSGLGAQFLHFKATFDAYGVIRAHAVAGLEPDPRYLTNFLGVRLNPRFLPGLLDGRGGEIEDLPIPGNWHACVAEWAAVLRAVDLARDRFSVIELGCGWGCWLNNTGTAAKRRGLAVHLIGVEGDDGHIGFAREACATNGFAESEHLLIRGIAGARAGFALFPKQDQAGIAWGLAPVFDATLEQRLKAEQSGRFDELPTIPMEAIAAGQKRIDLLHIDIQGGEADLVANCQPILRERVAYLVIGTHSRPIEGRLFDTLIGAGWQLEIERPAILTINEQDVTLVVDGVQGWRNPTLLPR